MTRFIVTFSRTDKLSTIVEARGHCQAIEKAEKLLDKAEDRFLIEDGDIEFVDVILAGKEKVNGQV